MAPETLEQQLAPALEQLDRFWTLRRRSWVDEARRRIRATDEQTAQLAQQQSALTRDLERHRGVLSQLQVAHQQLQTARDELAARHQDLIQAHAQQCAALAREQAEHQSLRTHHSALADELTDTRRQLQNTIDECQARQAALDKLHTAHQQLLVNAQMLREQLSATERSLASLQSAHDELGVRHQDLTQSHARQGTALEDEQAAHHALQLAYNALKHEATETGRQLLVAIDECKTRQTSLEELRGVHQQVLTDLRQHQEWLEQETASRVSLFQEKTALACQHKTLTGQHEALLAAHQAAMEQFHAMADLLGLAPEHVTDEGASLVSTISALLEREALVRNVLGAPARATDIRPAASDPQGAPFDHGVPFSQWLETRFVPSLGELHLQAGDMAQALTKARELETAVGVLENTPLLRDKFVVAVAGGFSSGKSSFITSLIQNRAVELPTGIRPVTSIPTYVITGAGDAIRGHTYRGGEIAITGALYKALSHDFVKSLGFNLRDILPYVTIETTLHGLNHVALVDLPGYDAAAAEGAYTATDEHTARKFMDSADAIVWLVGLDSNGTLPVSDLSHLETLATGERPLHVVLSKADLRPYEQVIDVLQELADVLEQAQIPYVGLSAYNAEQGEELQWHHQSLYETLQQWDRPGEPVARLVRQFGELVDGLELAIQRTYPERASMVDALHSLHLDFQELLSHLPDEGDPSPKKKTQESSISSAFLRAVLATTAEASDRTDTNTSYHARLGQLREDVNERLRHLQGGFSVGSDLAAARRMLAQLREEGMTCLQAGLV